MAYEIITGTPDDDEFLLSQRPDANTTQFMINTGFGDDLVRAGGLADEIRTSKGNDTVYAGAGDDQIWTGNHRDYIDAGHGNDYVSAGADDDIVKAGKGNDTVLGGSGNDMIYGIKGNNYLDGGTGDDFVHTGRQKSTALGGEGNDRLVADLSKGANHTLSGGAGADVFEFVGQNTKRRADVTITDFELGNDDMLVQGMTMAEWAAAHAAGTATISVTADEDGNAVIDLGFRDTVTLEGVLVDDLLAHFGF